MAFIHQRPDWPRFRWDAQALLPGLAAVRHRQGRLLGRMDALGDASRAETTLAALTQEALATSAIEGETLDPAQVRSSLARHLGIDVGALSPADRHVDGLVDVVLDATGNHAAPLTAERLHGWHAALFPTGWSGMRRVDAGRWRSGPLQVVSGAMGRERVHFEAPPAERLDVEMDAFLAWFDTPDGIDGVLRAGLAHLWFVTIHPFDDGNGRIGRALADMALARSEGSPQRFYSLSVQIRRERDAYYDTLEATQRGDMEVTGWLAWFLACLDRALDGAETTLARVLARARFWESLRDEALNDRQRKVIHRLLDGFEGNLTASKWAALAKTSPDTALRDIQDLLRRGILVRADAGGRSTHYRLSPREDRP